MIWHWLIAIGWVSFVLIVARLVDWGCENVSTTE
jgi:hypothetical protein